jgi:hypothetical protein
MVKCSSTLEEPTASVFTVANVVKVDGEVIQGKNCEMQSSCRVSGRSCLLQAVPTLWELRFPRKALLSLFTNGIYRNTLFLKHSLFGPCLSSMFKIKIKTLHFGNRSAPSSGKREKPTQVGLPKQNHVSQQQACIQCCKNCISVYSMQK